MPYRIKDVKFDFTDDLGESVPDSVRETIRSKTIGKVYYVEHPDFIADEISEDTGWCVLDLAYEDVQM